MRFGAHVSASGGVWNAPISGGKLGCEVIQFFSRSPQSFSAKPLTEEDCEKFSQAMRAASIQDAYIHAPYIINLASGNPRVRFGSIGILKEELARGSSLGARAVMFHPGSAKDVGEEEGRRMVVDGLNRILDGYTGSCQLLLEISAGAGAVLGDTFEDIAVFLHEPERGKDLGVCFDTQHAFASGYDLRTQESLTETFSTFNKLIGLDRLVASHCNDSKVEFGSHKDRHEHLGHGFLGKESFEYLVRHPNIQHIDLILETPFDEEEGESETSTGDHGSREEDLELLKRYRESNVA